MSAKGMAADCAGLTISAGYADLCAEQCAHSAEAIAPIHTGANIFGNSALARKCAERITTVHTNITTAITHYEQSYQEVHQKIYDLVQQITEADTLTYRKLEK